MRQPILIIGSLNMDMVIDMQRMPLKSETVMGRSLSYIPGGKGANQAFAVGMMGGRAAMLGCVGGDSLGRQLKENIQKSGTSAEGIAEREHSHTGIATIYVDDEGANSIVVVPGANSDCDVAYLKAHDDMIRACAYVVLQMEIPCDAIYYAVARAKELGKTVVLNPAPAPESIPQEILAQVDYLTPNETEVARLTGQKDLSMESILAGAHALLDQGVQHVLVTLGDKGALLVDAKGETHFPARKVSAVDTTAAGDCFNGAFVVGLSEGMDHAQAIRLANMASSIAVTRKGAQTSIPTRQEVDALL